VGDRWDIRNVTTMQRMFSLAKEFYTNLSWWDVSRVEDMSFMFSYASSFIGTGVTEWNISRVDTTSSMFGQRRRFKQTYLHGTFLVLKT
jgi:Mycoplasma protein of unknown function, DUF285